MTLITIPNRPSGSSVRSIEQILADFDAITAVVNGNLDISNFPAGGLPGKGKTVYGRTSGDYGTTSGTPAYIDSTNLSITLALPVAASVFPVEIGFQYHYATNNGGGACTGSIDFTCDGTEIDGKTFLIPQGSVSSVQQAGPTIVFHTSSTLLTAASHIIRPRHWLNSGSEFYIMGTAADYACFWVRQIAES